MVRSVTNFDHVISVTNFDHVVMVCISVTHSVCVIRTVCTCVIARAHISVTNSVYVSRTLYIYVYQGEEHEQKSSWNGVHICHELCIRDMYTSSVTNCIYVYIYHELNVCHALYIKEDKKEQQNSSEGIFMCHELYIFVHISRTVCVSHTLYTNIRKLKRKIEQL